MDGILIDGRVGKLWMCKKQGGHALGLHVRELQPSGLWLDLLLEFREAVRVGDCVDNKTVMLPDVKISGVVEGTKRDIECTVCAAQRTWFMGEAALERFFDSRRRRNGASSQRKGDDGDVKAETEVSHAS